MSEFSDESPTRQEHESPISRHSFSSRSALSVGNDDDDYDTDLQDETIAVRQDDEIPEESDDDDAVLDEPPRKKSLWDVVSRKPRVSKSDFNRKPRVSKSDFNRKSRVSKSDFNRKPRVSDFSSKGKSW